MADEAVLHYFDGRGKGELIRLTLCLAKVQFREVLIKSKEEFDKLKSEGKLYFGQLPLLELDGLNMTQTNAILRYLADKGNMVPADAKDRYKVDLLFEGSRDLYNNIMLLKFGRLESDEELKERFRKALHRYLPVFEQELKASGTDYLVGSSVTLADASLLEALLAGVDYFQEAILQDYPLIKEYYLRLKSRPEIETYMTQYRKRPNDQRYIEDLKTIIPQIFQR